jgi:hypothetical protein
VVLLLLALVTALLVPAAAMHVAAEKKAEETKQETLKKTQKKSTSSSKTTAKTAKTAKAAKKKTVTPPAPVAAAKVDASYFQGAVFIGDSRTQGLQLYSGLTTPRYLCAVGATVASIYNDSKVKTSSGKVPIMTALHQAAFSKVYIMLGVNELGWVYSKTFTNQYAKVIKDIRAINPDAKIVLQSILPVSAAQEAKHGYINNERIAAYNKLIEKLAADNSCTYLKRGGGGHRVRRLSGRFPHGGRSAPEQARLPALEAVSRGPSPELTVRFSIKKELRLIGRSSFFDCQKQLFSLP